MDQQMEFINLSPKHIKNLDDHLNEVVLLKQHILDTIDTFNKYAEAGKMLCSCMEKLSNSFQCYQEFQNDPTLQSISKLLSSFKDTLFNHYSRIDLHIVQPLDKFVNTDIKATEEFGKVREHSLENYNKCLENFVSVKKSKASKDPTNLQNEKLEINLMIAHGDAVQSDFNLHRSLELVERKKLIEITATFLAFINLLSVSFRECVFDYDDSEPEFATLRRSFPESSKFINNYADNTITVAKSLDSAQSLFWTRLHKQFSHTDLRNHEGWLWKKGSGFTKSWSKRYFVCRNGELSYYHNSQDIDHPKGQLNLLLTSVKPYQDPERRFTFTIISQQKVYVLQAMTQWDMDEWMAVIMNNIQYLLNHTDDKGNTNIPQDDEARAIGQLDTNDLFNSVNFLRTILDKPENTVCADCGAVQPSWCCINWGTCICIHCSGVHRSLTTSVSKVRSVTLDRLDRYTTLLLNSIGNAQANHILEALLEGKEPEADKLMRDQREEFIRSKYTDCIFVDDSVEIDLKKAIQQNDLMAVFHAICIMKKRQQSFAVFPEKKRDPAVHFVEEIHDDSDDNDTENENSDETSKQRHSMIVGNTNESPSKKTKKIKKKDVQTYKSEPTREMAVSSLPKLTDPMIKSDTNLTHQQKNQYTYLHLAASVGHPLITLLIAYNITDIDILDEAGWSPLSYASYYGNSEAAEALLVAGSNPNSSKVAHPYFIAKSLQNQIVATMFSPYWSGSQAIEPKPLAAPVPIESILDVQSGPKISKHMMQQCATLTNLGEIF